MRQNNIRHKNFMTKGLFVLLVYSLMLNLPYIHLKEFQGEEGRRVNIAVHMLETGEWAVPVVEGTIYLKKPPLYNWLLAGMFHLTGSISETSARLVSVLAAFLCALSLSLFWQKLTKSESVGFILPGLFFLTFSDVMGKAIKAEIDVTFTLFVTLSLIFWFYWYEVRKRPGFAWGFGLFWVGVGVLTKGVQAPLFFYAAIIPYLIYHKDIRRLFSRTHFIGILIFSAVISLWLIPLFYEVPLKRLSDVWWEEIVSRKEPTTHGGGFFRHLLEFPFSYLVSYLPWLPLIGLWISRPLKDGPVLIKKAAQFCFFCLLLSIPAYWALPGTLLRYLLPLSGMLAILLAIPVTLMLKQEMEEPAWFKKYFRILGVSLITLVIAIPVWAHQSNLPVTPFSVLLFGAVFVTCILWMYEKRPEKIIVFVLAGILFAKLAWASIYFHYHAEHLSHYRHAAQEINRIIPSNRLLYDYQVDNPHLAYYLRRPVRLIRSLEEGLLDDGSVLLVKKETAKGMNLSDLSFLGEVNARGTRLVLYQIHHYQAIEKVR